MEFLNTLPYWIGALLLVLGAAAVVVSLIMLIVALLQSIAPIRHQAGGDKSGPMGGAAFNPVDWANLLQAVSKLPVWALAMLAGDAQIWFGMKLMGLKVFV